ncbi:MAG: SBBP repeat-containing protein [Planctomycetota bacterium]
MKRIRVIIVIFLSVMLLIGIGAKGCLGLNDGTVSDSSQPLPSAVSNLTATVNNTIITLSWQDNSNNEDGFKIERSTDGVNFSQIAVLGSDITTYSDEGLTLATTYYYRVRAYNENGYSEYSNGISATITSSNYWTKQLGTASADEGYAVAVDTAGNIYVTGPTFGGLDGNINAGDSDLFLVKYDSAGVKQWTRQSGTASDDCVFGIAVDTAGNIYVTGYTFGELDGNTSAGLNDFFLIKYDSSGVKQWTRQSGTALNDSARSVAVDTVGNIYVAGRTDGGLDGNPYAGGGDFFLVKYDSSGVKQWTRQSETASYEEALAVAVDTAGNIYVTGYTSGGNANAGETDLFIVKYDSFGVKQWTSQLGTASNDRAQSVAVDTAGNIYVTGYTEGGLDGNTNAGYSDSIVVKYNAQGVKQWTGQLGTSDYESATGVAADASGNIYVTGYTNGGLDGNTNPGEVGDFFLVKYDSSGVKQWTRQSGTASDDVAFGVAVDTAGNIYVTGYTKGGLDGNTNAGSADLFMVKYNSDGVKQ